MSISGILSSSLSNYQLAAARTPYQQDFQQLSKDLQSGNLSAAQKDFSVLQQDLQANRFHPHHRPSVSSGDLTDSASSILQAQPPILIGGGPNPEPPLGRPVPQPPILIGSGSYPEPPLGRPVPQPLVSLLA